MGAGSFGDVKPCAEGLSESRIHYGVGYRIYFIQHEKTVIVGTKKTQSRFTFKMEINRRGMVKVRFFARTDFIFRKLEKGYSRQMIFDEIGKELDCT